MCLLLLLYTQTVALIDIIGDPPYIEVDTYIVGDAERQLLTTKATLFSESSSYIVFRQRTACKLDLYKL